MWLLFIPFLLFAESFITQYEYGEMLYNNPRGISCAKCHGTKGEGKVVTSFNYDKNGSKGVITAPRINNLSLERLKERLSVTKFSVMPKYDYLTDKEIKTIHNYLKGKKE